MSKLLQKLAFWRRAGESRRTIPVSEQRPNVGYSPSHGNPTPDTLDEQQAGKARGEAYDEHFRKLDEEEDSPRPNHEP